MVVAVVRFMFVVKCVFRSCVLLGYVLFCVSVVV